jgi:hypothetical protein
VNKAIVGLATAAVALSAALALAASSDSGSPVVDAGRTPPASTTFDIATDTDTSDEQTESVTATGSGGHDHDAPETATSGDRNADHAGDHDGGDSGGATDSTNGHHGGDDGDDDATGTTDGHHHDDGATGTTGSGNITTTTHAHHDDGSTTTTGNSNVTTTTHDHGGDDELDPETQAQLNAQIDYIREHVIDKYPHPGDATAAGWVRAGRFSPGAGAHYVNITSGMHYGGALDLDTPMGLIYDGIGPASDLVGVMYYSWQAAPPDAFAGPNDVWHKHASVCFTYNADGSIDIPFPVDTEVITRAMCEGRGGTYLEQTAWMLHVWAVPGWESHDGVFSHVNPDLDCADGTWNTDPLGFCDGSEVRR